MVVEDLVEVRRGVSRAWAVARYPVERAATLTQPAAVDDQAMARGDRPDDEDAHSGLALKPDPA
jgi:hypothetical protein